jgi:hypothetical protein
LCTRSIWTGSFEPAVLVGAGGELGDAIELGEPDAAELPVGRDVSVRTDSGDVCDPVTKPARAIPDASAITIKKGASVKSVPRGIDRIFIE